MNKANKANKPKRRFFGGAWFPSVIQDLEYQRKIIENFNSIFWIMAKNSLSLPPDDYKLLSLTQAKNWELKHGQDLRWGGVLSPTLIPVWYTKNIAWINKEHLTEYFESQIKRLLEYNFYSYDFLLEKVDYKGNIINDFLNQKVGEGHVEYFLEYASTLKKDSKIVLSDFAYKVTEKWDGNINLLKRFKNRNLIDSVVIQAQINVSPGLDYYCLDTLIKRIQDLGYEVELPECTVWENIYTSPFLFWMQEKIYHQLFDLVEQNQINTFGCFSPCDKFAWNHNPYSNNPGLWDKNYNHKKWVPSFLARVNNWLKQGTGE